MATDFNNVLQQLMNELKFQFDETGGWTQENAPKLSVEILAMEHNLHRARANYVNFQDEKRALEYIRIVTAMGFRCLKNNGCPPRFEEPSEPERVSNGKEKDKE